MVKVNGINRRDAQSRHSAIVYAMAMGEDVEVPTVVHHYSIQYLVIGDIRRSLHERVQRASLAQRRATPAAFARAFARVVLRHVHRAHRRRSATVEQT